MFDRLVSDRDAKLLKLYYRHPFCNFVDEIVSEPPLVVVRKPFIVVFDPISFIVLDDPL